MIYTKLVERKLSVGEVKRWLSKFPDDSTIGAGAKCCDCTGYPFIYAGELDSKIEDTPRFLNLLTWEEGICDELQERG